MLQLTPQSRIFVAVHPVDFRKGIDSLAALCRQTLGDNPLGGAVYVFRNRAGTTLKLLAYDGQGFWLCTKRLSQGRFHWWPTTATPSVTLSARVMLQIGSFPVCSPYTKVARGGSRWSLSQCNVRTVKARK
jgi:transposase